MSRYGDPGGRRDHRTRDRLKRRADGMPEARQRHDVVVEPITLAAQW
jgi:hypothetical protein